MKYIKEDVIYDGIFMEPVSAGNYIFSRGKGESMKAAEKAGRLFFAVIGLAGLLLLILPRTGISVDIVLSGSMEPAIQTGGLVFTDTRQKTPEIGDIITYRIKDSQVTHRVIRKEKGKLITKGDANDEEDLVSVNADQVIGKVVFTIPFLGYVAAFIRQKTVFAILILMILQELLFITQNERKERRARKKAQE